MKLRIVSIVFTISFTWTKVAASECGESTIPFSLEVLPSGQPILGCARPTCFGYSPNGHKLPTSAKFFRIDQQSDGFLRDDPLAIHTFDASDPRVYAQQKAVCEKEFQSLSCASEDQWIGGISPVLNATATTVIAYQCCTYPPLRASIDRGIATVSGGQIVIGGEVKENEKQYAFDYISNIDKKLDEEGEVFYEVNIRRFSCLDLQNHDRSVAELLNAENIIRHVNNQKPVALQAPILERPQGINIVNLETNENTFVRSQNVVVEEIIAQPGVIQEETEVPQGEIAGPQGPMQGPPPNPPVQQVFQPQPQPFQPQPFQPIQQPAQFPAAAQANYGYMPMGFASPTALQMYYCFPGDALVMQVNGTTKKMNELKVGDWVATLDNNLKTVKYIPVQYWLHRDETQEAEFLEFFLDNGETFSLTEKHLVYVTSCPPERESNHVSSVPTNAEHVKVGDCFFVAHRRKNKMYHRVKVLDVRTVKKTGIYAPMTSHGTILVNRVHTSCHSAVDNFSLQNSFFVPLLKFKNTVLDFFNEIGNGNKEGGIGLGANAILSVIDVVLPEKLFFWN